MGRVERTREIARRRTRRAKIKKLRKKYAEAKSKGQKEELVAKIHRLSPFLNLDEIGKS